MTSRRSPEGSQQTLTPGQALCEAALPKCMDGWLSPGMHLARRIEHLLEGELGLLGVFAGPLSLSTDLSSRLLFLHVGHLLAYKFLATSIKLDP